MNVQTYHSTDCKIKSVNLTFEEEQIELLLLFLEDEERKICKEIANVFIKAINQLHENKVSYLLRGVK